MPEIPMLGQAAARARAMQAHPAGRTEPDAPKIIEADTAFLVVAFDDGEVLATPDINAPVDPGREAHPHDIIGMLHAIVAQDDPMTAITPHHVQTALIVYRLPDGQCIADTNIDVPVAVTRAPHPHDVIGMSRAVITDTDTLAHAPYVANVVVSTQQAMAQAVMQQRQAQAVQQQLDKQRNSGRG